MKVLTVSYNSSDAPERFTESLHKTGFAVLSNHPIPEKLIYDTYRDWQNFYNSELKHNYTFDKKTQAGYFPFRTENAKNYGVKDLKEFFHLYDWNEIPAGMTSASRLLFQALSNLASELLGWIEDKTPSPIKAEFSMPLREMVTGSKETLLRSIHYPPLTGGEEDGAIRAAAHEDINLITLLPAATSPGLQVMDTAGTWHNVACDPGSIAINAGDMLQMASQGYYRSTTHRVVNPSGPEARQPRYSLPLFLHPRHDVFLSKSHTAGTYLQERLREIGLKS